MNNDYVFHAGEATVLAAEGQFTDAMPEILIGRTNGPVGQAFANMMAQSKGHTAMFAIRACNQLVRPATITVPKVTLKDVANIDLFGGVVKSFVFGLLVAGVGCMQGLLTGKGAAAVGLSTTRAVVGGIILIIITDGIFAVLYHVLKV